MMFLSQRHIQFYRQIWILLVWLKISHFLSLFMELFSSLAANQEPFSSFCNKTFSYHAFRKLFNCRLRLSPSFLTLRDNISPSYSSPVSPLNLWRLVSKSPEWQRASGREDRVAHHIILLWYQSSRAGPVQGCMRGEREEMGVQLPCGFNLL